MVKIERARKLLNVMLDALSDLKRYRDDIGESELRTDRDKQHMVLHALYLAVQSTIDLAFHVAAASGVPRPSTYQQVFWELADAKVLDKNLAERLAGWAGLRNVLAHAYPVIEFGKIHTALANELSDLERFAGVVSKMLQ